MQRTLKENKPTQEETMIHAHYESQSQLGSGFACSVPRILTLRTAEMLLNAVPNP